MILDCNSETDETRNVRAGGGPGLLEAVATPAGINATTAAAQGRNSFVLR